MSNPSTMSIEELLHALRVSLVPYNQSYPIVQLRLKELSFYPHAHVTSAIDAFERLILMHQVTGEKANPLEQLGIEVLLDSIYYERP